MSEELLLHVQEDVTETPTGLCVALRSCFSCLCNAARTQAASGLHPGHPGQTVRLNLPDPHGITTASRVMALTGNPFPKSWRSSRRKRSQLSLGSTSNLGGIVQTNQIPPLSRQGQHCIWKWRRAAPETEPRHLQVCVQVLDSI